MIGSRHALGSNRCGPLRSLGSVVFAVVLYSVMAGGCATDNSADRPERSPEEQAVDAARRTIISGLEVGFSASEERDSYLVRTRYNPPRCNGPAFEVRIHGKWTRAWLDGPNKMAESIQSYREELDGTSAPAFEIRGRVSGDREAETGVSYPVFWVTELEPES